MGRAKPETLIGSGKMNEVAAYVDEHEIGSVIFDDELTPAQQRNIEKQLRCKIIDRTSLILDIFAQRLKRVMPEHKSNWPNMISVATLNRFMDSP